MSKTSFFVAFNMIDTSGQGFISYSIIFITILISFFQKCILNTIYFLYKYSHKRLTIILRMFLKKCFYKRDKFSSENPIFMKQLNIFSYSFYKTYQYFWQTFRSLQTKCFNKSTNIGNTFTTILCIIIQTVSYTLIYNFIGVILDRKSVV